MARARLPSVDNTTLNRREPERINMYYEVNKTTELAEHLLDEFGNERAALIAWEMYTASVITRGELFTIKRVLKNLA